MNRLLKILGSPFYATIVLGIILAVVTAGYFAKVDFLNPFFYLLVGILFLQTLVCLLLRLGKYRQGRYSDWGSFLFHFSLFVLLAGVVVSLYYSFYGSLLIARGQQLALNDRESYLDISRQPSGDFRMPAESILLKEFNRIYQGDQFTDYIATLLLTDQGGTPAEHQVRVNQPLKTGGTVILLDSYGYAPLFSIVDVTTGKVVSESYYNLKVLTTEQTDQITLPDGNSITLRFFPDFEQEGRTIRTKSQLPQNPVFMATSGQDKGLLYLNKNVRFGKWEIHFTEVSYWVLFRVSRDPGKPIIYTSFILCVAGLILRKGMIR
ncbi:MAG TPA: cytochrome c biogenesis protein ResB [Bacillota bacterium]|nr:cytochrome c biogenesis protein ResB [Bacillota bacterium]